MLGYGCSKKEKIACRRSMAKKKEERKKEVAMSEKKEKSSICPGMIKERENQHLEE